MLASTSTCIFTRRQKQGYEFAYRGCRGSGGKGKGGGLYDGSLLLPPTAAGDTLTPKGGGGNRWGGAEPFIVVFPPLCHLGDTIGGGGARDRVLTPVGVCSSCVGRACGQRFTDKV